MSIRLDNSFFKRNYKCIVSLVSLLAVLIIAYPSRFYFLNDDFIHIPLAGKGSFNHSSLFRPLSDLSLWIDYKLWGKDPFGYHLTNLLLHLINSTLVYKLAQKIFALYSHDKLSELKSFLAGLLFLVYSYHSEPLFWIIGRGASLTTTFFLLAFYFYYKSEQWKGYLFFVLLSFGIGLFVYETIWIYPAVLTLDYISREDRRNKFKVVLLVWVLFLFFIGFRIFITGSMPDEYELGLVYHLNFYQLIYKYNSLVARCFLPPMQNSILFVSAYIIVLFSLLYSYYRIRNRNIYFNFICLMIAVLPTISLGIDTHDSESERFIYLATVFATFIIVEMISFLKKSLFISAFVLVYFFHLFKLLETSNSYEFSGMIAKSSLAYIKKSNSANLLFYNLPTQYKGALIFRTGFPNAINWINGQSPSTVNIVSQKEYKVAFGVLNTAITNGSQLAILNSNSKNYVSDKRINLKSFVPTEIFYWQKDSLNNFYR